MLSQRALNCPGNFVTLKNLSGKSFHCQIIIVQMNDQMVQSANSAYLLPMNSLPNTPLWILKSKCCSCPTAKQVFGSYRYPYLWWFLGFLANLTRKNLLGNTCFQCNSFNIILRLQIFLHCPPVPVPVNNGGLWINNKEPAAAAGSTLGHNAPPTTLCMCVLQRTF